MTYISLPQLHSLTLVSALVGVVGCAGRSPESLVPPATAADVAASRAACDSVISRAASRGQRVYRYTEVQVPADFVYENRGPRYPDAPAPASPRTDIHQEPATVSSVFVVDSAGHADTTTFQSTAPAPEKFLHNVKIFLPTARYKPAHLDGHEVAQCVMQTFVFSPN